MLWATYTAKPKKTQNITCKTSHSREQVIRQILKDIFFEIMKIFEHWMYLDVFGCVWTSVFYGSKKIILLLSAHVQKGAEKIAMCQFLPHVRN